MNPPGAAHPASLINNKMSKLSFRARALDASKPLPIYMSEELPDLPEYSAINRAVPQMPSGMEKEEECEHHLQRAIVTGLIIPTPEVTKIDDTAMYDRLYPPTYKPPRQLIRMQPFAMEEDYPDYDIDSEDEKWITMQKLDISPRKFEEMMDRLEKNCAQNFATQDRKELLLKDDDELSIAIYDYWLSKRLKTPQSLVPSVKTEANNRGSVGGGGGGGGGGGPNSNSNPYLAFRRRTEKMQTRKNRKNDEASYEKMIKLKRDLSRALTLLELVKRRETTKRQLLYVTIQLYEKRYEANDLSGALLAEVSALKSSRPAFTPLYANQYTPNHSSWAIKPSKMFQEEVGVPRKEKRPYKKRKHKVVGGGVGSGPGMVSGLLSGVQQGNMSMSCAPGHVPGSGSISSGEDDQTPAPPSPPSPTHQVAFPFLRNKNCTYQAPLSGGKIGNWGWTGADEGGSGEERYRFSLTSLCSPHRRCIGLARRRLGRGGRVILDRAGPSLDDFWSSLDFTIHDNYRPTTQPVRHFRPKSPVSSRSVCCGDSEDTTGEAELGVGNGSSSSLNLEVESVTDAEVTNVELDLRELFPELECDVIKRELCRVVSPPPGLLSAPGPPPPPPPPSPAIPGRARIGSTGGGGSSLLERWVESATDNKLRQASSLVASTTPSSSSLRTVRASDGYSESESVVGSSMFNVTDSKDRTRTLSNVYPDRSQHHSSTSAPLPVTNGPINSHHDYGNSWLMGGNNNGSVYKRSRSRETLSSSSPPLLNSKLPSRSANSAQINRNDDEGSGGGGGDDSVQQKRVTSLLHTHPMEVT